MTSFSNSDSGVNDSCTFDSFGFHPSIAKAIQAVGYTTPTPIQTQAIPVVMSGQDVLGLAQTGTGKTAAFMLPAIQHLITREGRGVRVLVIAPTRELCDQIQDSTRDYCAGSRIRSTTIYGGVGMNPQVQALRRGVEIVIACPGRLLDHIQQRTIDLRNVEMLVLDEADQMFDMGFLPNIRKILRYVPERRQTLLFSATMPTDIARLASDIMHDPATVEVGNRAPVETVSHSMYRVNNDHKAPLLLSLLEKSGDGSVLVFTRTKHRAKRLADQLQRSGHRATCLQGNLSQSRRKAAMEGFRNGSYQVLVATDIAARGIDVSAVSHVINFDVPSTPELYTHRIGRTGRASRTGDAFTFVTHEDASMVRAIERILGYKVPVLPLPENLPAPSAPSESDRDDRRHSRGPSNRPNRSGRGRNNFGRRDRAPMHGGSRNGGSRNGGSRHGGPRNGASSHGAPRHGASQHASQQSAPANSGSWD